MNLKINIQKSLGPIQASLIVCMLFLQTTLTAQLVPTLREETKTGTEATTTPVKAKPVKNTFESVWIIDNQTVMVPIKGTLEMDIMHRFGTVDKGYDKSILEVKDIVALARQE